MRTLQQDKAKDFNSRKLEITISDNELEKEIQRIKHWRKNVVIRFMNLNSSEYDNIIEQLSLKGY